MLCVSGLLLGFLILMKIVKWDGTDFCFLYLLACQASLLSLPSIVLLCWQGCFIHFRITCFCCIYLVLQERSLAWLKNWTQLLRFCDSSACLLPKTNFSESFLSCHISRNVECHCFILHFYFAYFFVFCAGLHR